MSDIVNFTPRGGALALSSPHYKSFLDQFSRAAKVVASSSNAVVPDLDHQDQHVIELVTSFLTWTRSFTKEQWEQGVPLNKEQMQQACGARHHMGYKELRACLTKLRSGNRKKGEPDSWTLSRPHIVGLAVLLAKNTAHVAAISAREIEDEERRIELAADLDVVLDTPSQFELDQQHCERQRLLALETPVTERMLPWAQRLQAKGMDELKVSVGTRDMEPLSDKAPENWVKLLREGI